jgi:hypothetical protein
LFVTIILVRVSGRFALGGPMVAFVQFVGILLAIVATVVLGRRAFGRPGAIRVALAPVVGAIVAFVGWEHNACRCMNGDPLVQGLVPGLCACAVVVCVRPRLLGAGAVLALCALGWQLSGEYRMTVAGGECFGLAHKPPPPRDPSLDDALDAGWHTPFTGLYHWRTYHGRVDVAGFEFLAKGIGAKWGNEIRDEAGGGPLVFTIPNETPLSALVGPAARRVQAPIAPGADTARGRIGPFEALRVTWTTPTRRGAQPHLP